MMHWIGATDERTLPAFAAFQRLADVGVVPDGHEPGHKDGWGLVAYHASGRLIQTSKKVCTSALQSEGDFLGSVSEAINQGSNHIISHLRKASPGMAITEENVHPFTYKQFSFCHNGLVEDFSHESLKLTEPFNQLRKGTNDSEHLFIRLLQEHAYGSQMSFLETLLGFAQRLRQIQFRSFTTISSDGEYVYICREVNERNSAFERMPHLVEQYYSFFLGRGDSGKQLIGCSEQLPIEGLTWQAIPNHTLVAIHRQTLQETWQTI